MARRRYEILLSAEFSDGRLIAGACPRCLPDSLSEVISSSGAFTFRPDAAPGSWTDGSRRYDDRLYLLIVDVDDTAGHRAWIGPPPSGTRGYAANGRWPSPPAISLASSASRR
jgi:hypothetical protein